MKLKTLFLMPFILIFPLFITPNLYAEMPNKMEDWMLGGFVRPEGVNPVIEPNPSSVFFCPMNEAVVKWEESDAFNPAAVVKDGKICVLYRAEDNSATGIGKRVSRVAMAESTDGVSMNKRSEPILYPAEDNNKQYEWPGGCEDPRVAVTEDGTYVIFYTGWDRSKARLCIATSIDLITWEKHGPAFAQAYDGKYLNTWSKAASIVTEIKNGEQVITKVNGRYFMYWGEYRTHAAVSDDLKNWTPLEDENGKLLILADTRTGYFDSGLVECGPPAVMTDKGILLLYNGKNKTNNDRDFRFNPGTYSAGQMLFDKNDPCKLIERTDVPFFRPMEDFEKSGQYRDGTVFIEGLVYYQKKWFLYYGCADSKVGVAVYDPLNPVDGDPIPNYPTPNGIAGIPLHGIGKQVVSIHSSSGETKQEESTFNLLYTHVYPGKKWCEDENENPWVVFELADYYNIERIIFRDACTHEPLNGNVPEYWIYVSTTGTADDDWIEIIHKTNQGDVDIKDDILEFPVEARYIKFVASRGYRKDNGAKENAIRIYGFDIYGTFSRAVERENLVSVGKSVLYYYNAKDYYQLPLHLFDGNKTNFSNKWSFDKPEAAGISNFVIVDLEDEYEIEKFVIYDSEFLDESEISNVSGYKIYVSTEAPDLNKISGYKDENTVWQMVVNRNGKGRDDVKIEEIEPVSARYVKLEIPRSNILNGVAIYQFEIYRKAEDTGNRQVERKTMNLYPSLLKRGESLSVNVPVAGKLKFYNNYGTLIFDTEINASCNIIVPLVLSEGIYFVSFEDQFGNRKNIGKIVLL